MNTVTSAVNLAHAILATDALITHKRQLLTVCIWKVTEANGKYNVRYWSEGIYNLVQEHGSIRAVTKLRPLSLRHEHVNPRKQLIDAMLANPDDVERILGQEAFACLVTKDEHRRLSNDAIGFERYRQANIRVWDTASQDWL
ncbi:MAG: hypothetical protein ACOCXR_02900 [Phototrophicaceae bacterium]